VPNLQKKVHYIWVENAVLLDWKRKKIENIYIVLKYSPRQRRRTSTEPQSGESFPLPKNRPIFFLKYLPFTINFHIFIVMETKITIKDELYALPVPTVYLSLSCRFS